MTDTVTLATTGETIPKDRLIPVGEARALDEERTIWQRPFRVKGTTQLVRCIFTMNMDVEAWKPMAGGIGAFDTVLRPTDPEALEAQLVEAGMEPGLAHRGVAMVVRAEANIGHVDGADEFAATVKEDLLEEAGLTAV